MNKETLEKAANKQWGNVHRTGVLGFIEGAKWQQERMYSEEEVFKIIASLLHTPKLVEESSWEDIAKWFEQFKKK